MKLKCKCGYVWDYKGSLIYASCPSCYKKVNVADSQVSESEAGPIRAEYERQYLEKIRNKNDS